MAEADDWSIEAEGLTKDYGDLLAREDDVHPHRRRPARRLRR
jgi:hypothetical protein